MPRIRAKQHDMFGQMMAYPLTIPSILHRAAQDYPGKEIVRRQESHTKSRWREPHLVRGGPLLRWLCTRSESRKRPGLSIRLRHGVRAEGIALGSVAVSCCSR
jgi:hypothetical protein